MPLTAEHIVQLVEGDTEGTPPTAYPVGDENVQPKEHVVKDWALVHRKHRFPLAPSEAHL